MKHVLRLLCMMMPLMAVAAVELSSFDAVPGDDEVTLYWTTVEEIDNDHFEIVRNDVLVATIEGAGNSSGERNYEWLDTDVTNGITYFYLLVAVDINGEREELAEVSATPMELSIDSNNHLLPTQFALSSYPNPFNPTTTISYSVPKARAVSVKVFDITGRMVATLVDEMLMAGEHTAVFDGSALPSGLYFAQLRAGDITQTQKMVLLK